MSGSENASKRMGTQVLLHASNTLADNIVKLNMQRTEFLNLLNMFVSEGWSNHETYNNFIRGFGNNFDAFSDTDSVNFISLLVRAGLNQADILDAVIEKLNTSKSWPKTNMRIKK